MRGGIFEEKRGVGEWFHFRWVTCYTQENTRRKPDDAEYPRLPHGGISGERVRLQLKLGLPSEKKSRQKAQIRTLLRSFALQLELFDETLCGTSCGGPGRPSPTPWRKDCSNWPPFVPWRCGSRAKPHVKKFPRRGRNRNNSMRRWISPCRRCCRVETSGQSREKNCRISAKLNKMNYIQSLLGFL